MIKLKPDILKKGCRGHEVIQDGSTRRFNSSVACLCAHRGGAIQPISAGALNL